MNFKNRGPVFLLIFLLSIPGIFAQNDNDAITLTRCLVVKLPGARGAMLTIDPIELALATDKWVAPTEGDHIKVVDETSTWEPLNADANGWFDHEALRHGYGYFTIAAKKDRVMLLEGMGNDLVYVNGILRTGNRYGFKENWESWEPNFNYAILPIQLHAGTNQLLFFCTRSGRLKVKLTEPDTPVFFNTRDVTVPDPVIGEPTDTWGSIVVINASGKPLKNLVIQSQLDSGPPVKSNISIIQPMTVRKVAFQLQGPAPVEPGSVNVQLQLWQEEKQLAVTTIQLQQVKPSSTHKRTFTSHIDGSVQYYAINPAKVTGRDESKALVLSVHGAGVEAVNQANSYHSKTWAHIVAPTNRRPYGYNWEDWGRTDALEVLDICQRELNINPDRVYLTGHSMGGHGTWHLGFLFPDRFAAIGPSAGWISFWSYRVRDRQPEETPMQKMLMRSTLPGNTFALAENSKQYGVYVLHGSDDDNVPVQQAQMIVEHLNQLHQDLIYHEEPGQGHWWDLSDEPGTDCVDWAPLFDFFARHARPGKDRIRQVDFLTANPGISSSCNWLTIDHQNEPLKLSTARIRFDPGNNRYVGTTENVARLSLDVFNVITESTITVELDGQQITGIPVTASTKKIWLAQKDSIWTVIDAPAAFLKGSHRYGTFKDAFNNRFLFVYGTKGHPKENDWAFNKARFDAEYFWYQGNGSIDIVADVDFDPSNEQDRNVIIYGNANTNAAWNALLSDSPVQVGKGLVRIGAKKIKGNNIACLFIRPRPGSEIASVGVVAGTGSTGMRLTDRRLYLSPGYAFPDCLVFSTEIPGRGSEVVLAAGFFGEDWSVNSGEFIWSSE